MPASADERIAAVERVQAAQERRLQETEAVCARIRRAYKWVWSVIAAVASGLAVNFLWTLLKG